MKQTKIVCSISDFRCDTEFLRHLFFAGMNVVRMNTAHATEEGMRTVIKNVRSVSPHIGILIDTKGPEVRTTAVASPINYKIGDVVKIFGRPEMETTHDIINVSYPDFCNDVKVGDHVLFDDGALDLTVMENIGPMIVARVENDGTLGSKKSVNVPGEHIDLPALTEKDRKNILFAIEQDIDFIAHSFVRSASDVHAIQEILDEHHSDIKIISKIENQEGVDNIDEIIEASYGIMIARGDLGIEIPLERIPGIQREIIRKCVAARKPVIVATQMLHSMINNPRPTRAETMSTIAEQAERDRQRLNGFELPLSENCSQKEFLAHAAIDSTRRLGVAGIIADSMTGEVVRYLASFRGPKPILAICYREKTQRLLNLSYGVIPIYQHDSKSPEYIFLAALRMLRQKGYVDLDDKIAYLSGNLGLAAGTTFLEINPVRRVFENIDFFHLPQYAEQRIE